MVTTNKVEEGSHHRPQDLLKIMVMATTGINQAACSRLPRRYSRVMVVILQIKEPTDNSKSLPSKEATAVVMAAVVVTTDVSDRKQAIPRRGTTKAMMMINPAADSTSQASSRVMIMMPTVKESEIQQTSVPRNFSLATATIFKVEKHNRNTARNLKEDITRDLVADKAVVRINRVNSRTMVMFIANKAATHPVRVSRVILATVNKGHPRNLDNHSNRVLTLVVTINDPEGI